MYSRNDISRSKVTKLFNKTDVINNVTNIENVLSLLTMSSSKVVILNSIV